LKIVSTDPREEKQSLHKRTVRDGVHLRSKNESAIVYAECLRVEPLLKTLNSSESLLEVEDFRIF